MRGHDTGHRVGEISRLQKSEEYQQREDSLRDANFASFARAHRGKAFGRNHQVLKTGWTKSGVSLMAMHNRMT